MTCNRLILYIKLISSRITKKHVFRFGKFPTQNMFHRGNVMHANTFIRNMQGMVRKWQVLNELSNLELGGHPSPLLSNIMHYIETSLWKVLLCTTVDGSEIPLTSWYGKYHIVYKVLYIPSGAGFLPSTVVCLFWMCSCFCWTCQSSKLKEHSTVISWKFLLTVNLDAFPARPSMSGYAPFAVVCHRMA